MGNTIYPLSTTVPLPQFPYLPSFLLTLPYPPYLDMTSLRLGAGVVTKSVDNALKLSDGLRAGTVYVNCYDVFDANTPFGGYKDSGVGREFGEPGNNEFYFYSVH